MTLHSPSASVDRIDSLFARMLVRYGTGWTRMWEGVDIDAVKAEWADELSQTSDEAIFYALDYMPPERPPTVKQFRAICNNAPPPVYTALPSPPPTEEKKAAVRMMLAEVKKRLVTSRLA